MKVFVLAKDESQSDNISSAGQVLISGIQNQLQSNSDIEVSVVDEASFSFNSDMCSDNSLVVVIGDHGNEKAKALKEKQKDITIVGIMNRLSEQLVNDLAVDAIVTPSSFQSAHKNDEENYLKKLKEEKSILVIDSGATQSQFHLAAKEICQALVNQYVWQAIEEKPLASASDSSKTIKDISSDKGSDEVEPGFFGSLSNIGTSLEKSISDAYKAYPTATKVSTLLLTLGGLGYVGSKTQTGRGIVETISNSFGYGSSSNSK